MKSCSYHVLLVVDKEGKILGLISSEDLLGEKPLKAIQERRIARADISVGMVMTPQTSVVAIDIEDLRHAKVGHLVATLHTCKQHYALAVKIDETNNKQVVRGLFSLSLIGKQLSEDVTSDVPEAHSIAELHHDVHLND
jgi:Mg2+/Co2+ transporter CorB